MTHRTRTAAAVLATVLLLACQSGASPAELLTGPVRVVDGDTLDVYGRAGRVRVRIYGIDTPERGERGYDSATAALRDLVAAGPIECHPRPGEVTYGRIVATCIVAGQDLALALLRAGQAAPWCSYLRGDPLEQSYLAAAAMADGPPAKPRHRCPSRRPSP